MATLNGMAATFKKIPETTHKALIAGDEVIPFAAQDGTFYYITRDELFNQLGGLTAGFVGVIDTSDTLDVDGIYIPESSGIYNNADGLVIDTADGLNLIIKNGSIYQKAVIPVPVPENKIPQWVVGAYDQGDQVLNGGSVWEATVNTSQEPNGSATDWKRVVWGSTGNIFMGQVTPSSPLNTDGVYIPVESGTYPNAGGVEVDVTDGFTVIVKNGSNYDKVVYPVSQPLIKNSMDDLRAISGDELMRLQSGFYKFVQLQGYYDGEKYDQPINYVWVADSVSEDDGGSVVQVTGVATGRFIHDFKDVVDVRYFGAKGDGSDDTDSFLGAAALALPLFIPPISGHYALSQTIPIRNSVSGYGAILKFSNNTACIVIGGSAVDELIYLEGFEIEGPFDGVSSDTEFAHGMNIQVKSGIRIREVKIGKTKGDNIYIANGANDIIIERCNLSDAYRNSISLISCYGIKVLHNDIDKAFDYVTAIDIEANTSGESIYDITVKGNRINTTMEGGICFNVAAVGTVHSLDIDNNKLSGRYGIVAQPNDVGAVENVRIVNNEFDNLLPITNQQVFDIADLYGNKVNGTTSTVLNTDFGFYTNSINATKRRDDARLYDVMPLMKAGVDLGGTFKILRYSGGENNSITVSSDVFHKPALNSGFYTDQIGYRIGTNLYKITLPPVLTPYELVSTNTNLPVSPGDLMYFQYEIFISDPSVTQIVTRKLPNAVIVNNRSIFPVGKWVTIRGSYVETTTNNAGLSIYLYKSNTDEPIDLFIRNLTLINTTAKGVDIESIPPVLLDNAVTYSHLYGDTHTINLPSLKPFDFVDIIDGVYHRHTLTKDVIITSKTWSSDGLEYGGFYEFTTDLDSDCVGMDTSYGAVSTNITKEEGFSGGGMARLGIVRLRIRKSVIDSASGATLVDKFLDFITSLGRDIYLYTQYSDPVITNIEGLDTIKTTIFSEITCDGITSIDVAMVGGDSNSTVIPASPDSAASPSATYNQAEAQGILDELRDLKTKMRTAGILAI